MRIVRVESYVLRIPAGKPYLGDAPPDGGDGRGRYLIRPPWRSLYARHFETLLVRLTADDGNEGWGEALAPVGAGVPAAVVDELLRDRLVGVTVDGVVPVVAALRELMRERGHLVGHQADALAAVDIALWDLLGRHLGRPVVDLLGGAFRTDVPTYVSGLSLPDDRSRAAAARAWAERGGRRIKLHLGYGVDADLATVDAVAAAHPDLRLAVDAHWAYDLSDALRLGRELAWRRVLFLEAPLAPEDLDGHAELCRRVEVRIAVGEALRNRYEFAAWLGRRALHVAQPDVARTGISEAMVIAHLAAAAHVPVAPHHSTGLGVALAAGLHLAAAVETMPYFEFQPTTFEVASTILREPLATGADVLPLPSGPGLGVEVDLDVVQRIAKES